MLVLLFYRRSNNYFVFLLQDLFFKYIWNNFLHTHVTQCLFTILNNPPIEVDGNKESPLLNQVS